MLIRMIASAASFMSMQALPFAAFQRCFSVRSQPPGVNADPVARSGLPLSRTRDYGRAMEFRILGALEVSRNGSGPIALGGAKQRAVLAHLLLRANHLVPTDVLIDEVWGEEPPETARNALQSYASHLRKALGPERLEGSRAGYRLRAEPSEVDAARFESLVRDSRRLVPIDARAAVGAFDHALALWRGPAFAELTTQSSLQAEAARLDDLRLAALEDRIDAQLTIAQHGEVIGELDGLTARHPLRERFWEQLMLALYRAGRQGEALAAYQRAREILADELGIDPSPALRRLHERILAQSPDLDPGGEPLRGYRLLERIGENSVGTLYRATQPNVGREVAIRIMHEHRANDPTFVRGFEAQAQAVAALEHPHIAPVYDYWREPGRAYLVTRFLSGGSLEQLLDRSRPPERERATRILEQVASALAAAHRRGIGHGELGSSNVLFDEEGNAYVTDFSIGTGGIRGVDDVEAFATLTRETLDGHVPMSMSDVLRRADGVAGMQDVAPFFAEIASSIGSREEPSPTLVGEIRNPYKGLRPFIEADAGDFFGRETFVARLVERMAHDGSTPRFIAVVGPSGSGKSSVVRAGLVSAIREGAISGSQDWIVTEMHPGHRPFDELDDALMRVAVDPPAGLLSRLESGPRGLVEVANVIVPEGSDLLLVVDQFEEAFTLTENEYERALFLESLRIAAVDPTSRVRVIATLRADFYDRPLRYPRMGPLLGSTTEVLSPLTPEELERAIVRPAERSGLQVDRALVPQIAADASEQPGALPLVQYALTELFGRRDGGRLTLDAYREIGGVGGALAASAEHLYATRRPAGREAVRQLFLRLVTPGEGAADTRRRVPLSELSTIEIDRSAMEAAIDAYGRHRLLTFDRDPATREPTVEIAHEALLGAWDRLRGWIDEAREDVRMRRRLSDAAREWNRSEREPSFLLTGSRLDQFESWGSSTSLALGLEERGYLSASIARRDEEREIEGARRDREHLLERRSVKRLRALVAALTAVVVVTATLTAIALNRNAEAQRESRLTTARELVSAATANLERDPELAHMLALEAAATPVDGAVIPEAEELLRRAAPAVSIDTARFIGPDISSYNFTPAGDAVAIVGGDGSIGVWDLITGARRLALPSPGPSCNISGYGGSLTGGGLTYGCPDVFTVDLSDDGSRLAAGDGEGLAHVWDLASGRAMLTVPPDPRLPTGMLGGRVAPAVALSPDGGILATGGIDGAVRLWDTSTGQRMMSISTQPGPRRPIGFAPWLLSFNPDGSRLYFAGTDGTFHVADVIAGRTFTLSWDRFWRAISADGSRFATQNESGNAWTFSPDGDVVAGGVGNHVWFVHIDALSDGRRSRPFRVFRGHTQRITAVAFSEDGMRLATGSLDGTARVWNVTSGDVFFTSPVESSDVEGVAFSEDGSRVTAIYSDGRIIVQAIALEDVIAIASARVTRGFTDEECRTYLHVATCPAE
jgi:DNA-binding SARP family transcriptional activator/WD40 repeat protein